MTGPFRPAHMKFGIFMAPLHHLVGDNPSLSMEQDLELLEHLDRLGFDEAWLGEHHSSGVEIYADPFMMIAAAAQRTRRIMLGTGVVDLPFHHPFMIADRAVMADHLTRGRAMLGAGTGALRADFTMIGRDPAQKGRMSEEALAAIMALLKAEEPVTMKTNWFELKDARLQLASYTKPHLPVAVAGSSSEERYSSSGRYGIILLSTAGPAERLQATWPWVEESAARFGQTADRSNWRVAAFFHLAESRDQALHEVESAPIFAPYGPPPGSATNSTGPASGAGPLGRRIIGTPDDAIEAIETIILDSGGFGGFLGIPYGALPREKVFKSYELFARYVAPRFQGQYETMKANNDWLRATGGGPGGFGPTPAAPEAATPTPAT